jgi:hypothetical protein
MIGIAISLFIFTAIFGEVFFIILELTTETFEDFVKELHRKNHE